MALKDDLAKIVGEENVSDVKKERVKYSRDYSLVPPGVPDAVVWPKENPSPRTHSQAPSASLGSEAYATVLKSA